MIYSLVNGYPCGSETLYDKHFRSLAELNRKLLAYANYNSKAFYMPFILARKTR